MTGDCFAVLQGPFGIFAALIESALSALLDDWLPSSSSLSESSTYSALSAEDFAVGADLTGLEIRFLAVGLGGISSAGIVRSQSRVSARRT